LTFTAKLHVREAMLLTHVTVVTPSGKLDPDGGEQVIVPQLPVGVGAG
jgi:hypothetical protein